MYKKIVMLGLMVMYIYTLTFNIFMTGFFRIPAPIVLSIPLMYIFGTLEDEFKYIKEMFVFLIACMFIYLIGQERIVNFAAALIVIFFCAMYFNYFVGFSLQRLQISVFIFFALLFFSSIVMMLDHRYPAQIMPLRSMLAGEVVTQSPSGIATSIFNFGYQIAALTTFLVIYAFASRRNLLILAAAFGVSITFILYGMNRSVLLTFGVCVVMFWFLFYRFKAMFIMLPLAGAFLVSTTVIKELSQDDYQQNILTKNEASNDEKSRGNLVTENLKIIADYPLGLAYHDKTWDDVAGRNPAFKRWDGLVTSHNAYLMYLTYVGIVIGLPILLFIYLPIMRIGWKTIQSINDRNQALLISLIFAFISTSLNAMFHNEWILSVSGPTLFLYFAILQLYRIQSNQQTGNKIS